MSYWGLFGCCLCPALHPQPLTSLGTGSLQGSWEFLLAMSCPHSACMETVKLLNVSTAAKSLQSCLTVQPHRRQPTRFPCPWDSPGKNTGVGCHFLLQCMKVKIESKVARSCPTLRDPVDCGLPGSSLHGSFQSRVLEWGAIAFSELICEIVNKSRKSKRAGL